MYHKTIIAHNSKWAICLAGTVSEKLVKAAAMLCVHMRCKHLLGSVWSFSVDLLLWACEEEGQARLEDDESNWQKMRERKKSETVLKFGEMHTSHINGICLSCPLFFGEKEAHTRILRQARRYTEIAWPFSSSINMRRAICCNHAQSIASCGGEPFHILWIYPSLYTQWHQFKCKSWHSHHSALRRLLYQKPCRIGPDLNEPRSAQLYISSVCWSVCVRENVRQTWWERKSKRERDAGHYRDGVYVCRSVWWRWCSDCVLPFLREGRSCLPLPCHVQYPAAIQSWMIASKCGSVFSDLCAHKEALSYQQHVHTYSQNSLFFHAVCDESQCFCQTSELQSFSKWFAVIRPSFHTVVPGCL